MAHIDDTGQPTRIDECQGLIPADLIACLGCGRCWDSLAAMEDERD